MTTRTHPRTRELAAREGDGIRVVLLWHPREDTVTVETTREAGDAWLRAGFADQARVLEASVDALEKRLASDKAPSYGSVHVQTDDLDGVVRAVRVTGERVEIDFTPTFLGCPALEVMRSAMEERVRALGGQPDVRVVTADGWTSDRITPEGREKLRAAGFAPPMARPAGAVQLVQLQRGADRCPYCSSTDTTLENLFGPTPCRSIRYCNACRQPFEQFTTI